ncbi:TPA: hypothetical protein ACH3X3_014429 [Trebouxia sp. C0006]
MGLFSILKDKAGQGPDHSELAELSDHTVASRAKSEFAPKRQAHFTEAPIYRPANDSPKIAALYKAGPSKSFTANTTAMSHLHLAAESSDSTIGAQITPEDVEYTSNAQFQSRVELYRGSISTVYKALCSLSKDTVIIKAYEKAKMKTKNFLRMEREIKLMRCLVGEGLAQLYGVFEDQTHKTLVMEYCKGGDLFKLLLLKGGSLDEHWVCIEIIVPLLRVLVLMHEQHILHRDIKPENIFLTGKHKLKLGDLGLAIRSNEELPFTRSGTLDYMAPEVLANPTADIQEGPKVTKAELKARGVRPYDEKVDVWATGILAYELVVGRPPFEVNDEVQTATMIMFSNNISYPPKHSALWADFVKVALEKKPHIRPTALQMLDHPWIAAHQQKHSTTQAAVQMRTSGEVAPLHPTVVNTVEALPPVHELPPVVLPSSAAALKKSASSGSALHGRLDQKVQEALVSKPFPPLATPAVLHQHRPVEASASSAAAVSAGQAVAAAHLKQQLGSVSASGSSFTSLMQSAKARPPMAQYIDSGEVLAEEDRTKAGIRIRMKHYFTKQKGIEVSPPS